MSTPGELKADQLMAEWMREWFRDKEEAEALQWSPYFQRFSEFIDLAVESVEAGQSYSDVGESSYERAYARHHGGGEKADWPEPQYDEDLSVRAWSYYLSTPEEVLDLLKERGQSVTTPARRY